jgi:hypothetical protein
MKRVSESVKQTRRRELSQGIFIAFYLDKNFDEIRVNRR